MTFGRWLLVHSLSICILVMLGVGYFFKNELKLNEAYRQLLQIDGELISLNSQMSKSPTEEIKVETNSVEETQVEINEPEDVTKEFVFKPMPQESNDTEITSKARDSSVDKVINKASTESTIIVDKPVLTPADFLLMARQAYWNRDYQLSIDSYAKEIVKQPNSPDLYGELGNVYYTISDFDSAATNYLKAGKMLIRLDDQVRAKKIYDILVSIAPEKAEVLLLEKNQKYQ